MEPLNPAILARVQEYRRQPPSPAPKVSPPVAKAPKVASLPRGQLGEVVAAVCEAWMISPADLLSIWRPHRISYPRFAAMRLMRRVSRASYPQLGVMFGKDHSSVLHAMKRCHELMKEDSAWRACYLRALATLETRVQAVPAGGDIGTAHGQRQGQIPAKPVSAAPASPPLPGGRAPDAMPPNSGIGRNFRGAA